MSETQGESRGEGRETGEEQVGIPDEQLPEDLVPGEDNPLAEPLEPGESVDDLLEGGKRAEQGAGDPAEGFQGSGRAEPDPADTPGAGEPPSDTSHQG